MITTEFKTKIVGALKQTMSDKQLSQSKIASTIGVSPAMITQMINSNWQQIADKMWNKVASYLRLDEWQIIKTVNFNTITKLCEDAQENQRMVATAGPTGYGKTTALEHYHSKNPECYYVLCTNTMGRKDFVQAIMQSMGIDADGPAHKLIKLIIAKLHEANAPLLILDDAGKLKDVNLQTIQIIRDATVKSAGIVLAGTEYLWDYVYKMAKKNKLGFRELERRIGYWLPLHKPTRNAVDSICKLNGITNEDAVNYIYLGCTNYGAIEEFINNARRARNQKHDINDVAILSSLQVGAHNFNHN